MTNQYMIGIHASFKTAKQKEDTLNKLKENFECEIETQDTTAFTINLYVERSTIQDSSEILEDIAKYFENVSEGYADLYMQIESKTLHKET